MPIELLQFLSESDLPLRITTTSEIDKVRVLAAANMVQAQLPDVFAHQQHAVVLSITNAGRAALERGEGGPHTAPVGLPDTPHPP